MRIAAGLTGTTQKRRLESNQEKTKSIRWSSRQNTTSVSTRKYEGIEEFAYLGVKFSKNSE